MSKENVVADYDWEEVKSFNKYLVFYSPEEKKTGLKGIRKDAPPEAVKAFLDWYRDKNRYENGRIRPLSDAMIRKLLVDVS